MDLRKIARMTARYRSGILTAREWADSLLHDLVSAPEIDAALVSAVDALPPEVVQEFRHLLATIREADFRWAPFFLTSSAGSRDLTEYSTRLRRVSAMLDERRAHGEVSGPGEPGSRQPAGAGEISSTLADTTRA